MLNIDSETRLDQNIAIACKCNLMQKQNGSSYANTQSDDLGDTFVK